MVPWQMEMLLVHPATLPDANAAFQMDMTDISTVAASATNVTGIQ